MGASTGGTVFGYYLAENISLSDGSYTWQPANVSQALQSTQAELVDGDEFYFEAKLHDANSSSGAEVDSEKYSVTGYPYLEGAAASVQVHIGVVLAVVASVVVSHL
ncbi:hypothetical protein CERZMDRAFT_91106 [Cercospora zeae-maydis SCOH1-5]|uniref:Uncharacterized protein n=1 Tax=Cercospora zeae-maydis SCOH1-5 TaxID=717836 RepID=A0A6A6FAZ3_9PEZI|nr:hypothetical protein CERZMDRAFT_91106 [Cercospora zeae-maydis SCOH1-5]